MLRFGSYLKLKRKQANLTQEHLARSIKVSNTYIHQLETGKIDAPTERRCRQLADVLDVDSRELWDIARRERFERFAEREGFTPGEELSILANGSETDSLTPAEWALVKLYRNLDDQTRNDFNGLVAMLFRHIPRIEVQENLKEYLRSA